MNERHIEIIFEANERGMELLTRVGVENQAQAGAGQSAAGMGNL